MANLIAVPSRWHDGASNSPPVVWNGTLYDFTGYDGNVCSIMATTQAGDTVSFDLNNLAASNSPGGLMVDINGSQVWDYDLHNVGTASYVSGALNNGDVVQIWANVQFLSNYVVDFTLSTSSPPFAPDESIVVQKNSTGNVVLPSITENGVPLSSYTLAIVGAAGHGAASVSGHELLYTPVANYTGPDVFTYKANDGTLDSNVATVNIQVVAPCTELGRVTKANVSAFTRNQIHKAKLMAQEVRCLVANFNGALCKGRTIASVIWSVSNPMFVNLLRCEITGRETACLLQAQWRGSSLVRCVATLDNGEAYTQYFAIAIDGYWFQGDVPLPQGPYTITATA